MKVFEIFSQPSDEPKIDFDLQDDLIFFMRNDPEFYRTRLFPFQTKFEKAHYAGHELTPALFKNIVNSAYSIYKKKFPVDGLKDALTPDEVQDICVKLHNDELTHYKEKGQKEN